VSRLRLASAAPDKNGVVLDVTPQSAGWNHVGFRVVHLAPQRAYSGLEAGREACIVVLSGTAKIVAGEHVFEKVGTRINVFEDAAPGAVYVPQDTPFRIDALTPVEIALCTAPGAQGYAPRRLDDKGLPRVVRGEGANSRLVRDILPETSLANALLVVEVITPAGNWSSYPPHKHDTARDGETALEETYYHRLSPPQGFAFQRIYTDDRSIDETLSVEDGDVVMVPRGYHPVAAPYGYDLYYLNVMAGPERRWKFYNDPAHEWMLRSQAKPERK
jgi:5-deoxy-glucuronate isomerase